MSSTESVKLTDKMREKFPSTWDHNAEKLVAGVYRLNGFDVVDDEKYNKRAYLMTQTGKCYTTTSGNIVGSLLSSVGATIKEALQNGAKSVEVEVVPKQANTGRWGIAFKAF